MKRIITLTYTILLLIAGPLMLAQTYAIGNSPIISGNLQNRAAQLNLLTSQKATPSNSNAAKTNAIYIQQVGNNNDVISNTRSLYSNINLIQRGNNNEVGLNVTAGIINENIFQNGSNHKFFDFSSKGTILHSAAVYQSGRNQNLLWYGDNSISEKMMVRMNGKNQTVIIRNIKR
jgi:hypothetical protein